MADAISQGAQECKDFETHLTLYCLTDFRSTPNSCVSRNMQGSPYLSLDGRQQCMLQLLRAQLETRLQVMYLL